jgi:hypothetical protein
MYCEKVFSKELLEKMKDENPFRKLSEIVYEMTEDAIISCELHPGTQLNTVKISKLLDISRTPGDGRIGAAFKHRVGHGKSRAKEVIMSLI